MVIDGCSNSSSHIQQQVSGVKMKEGHKEHPSLVFRKVPRHCQEHLCSLPLGQNLLTYMAVPNYERSWDTPLLF